MCALEITPPEEIPFPEGYEKINPFAGRLTRLDEFLSRKHTRDWIFEGLCCRGDLMAIYGQAKAGKSFTAIDLALCAATGTTWCEHRFRCPEPRTVVYCFGEGDGGMQARWRAATAWHERASDSEIGLEAHRRITILDIVPKLFVRSLPGEDGVPGSARQFVRTIRSERGDERVDLVVIDTLNRASIGAEENSARDMGIILEAAGLIQKELGAAVLLIHHSDKQGRGMRGSGALRAAVDVALKVEESGNGRHLLSCDAIKDAVRFEPIGFYLWELEDSAAINWSSQETPGERALRGHESRILEHLRKNPDRWLSARTVAAEIGIVRTRASEALGGLLDHGLVVTRPENPETKVSTRNPATYTVAPDSCPSD